MDRGFEAAGFRTALACERDGHAADTWAGNFRGRMHRGDVRDLIPTLQAGMADVLFGGPPCQGYSVAGKMDPEDPRSQLVFSFMEAVGRVRPSAFVMENVDALARLGKWRGSLDDIRSAAGSLGYATCVMVLDAADFSVPQSRRRMFIWGSRLLDEASLAEAVSRALAPLKGPRIASRAVFDRFGPAGTELNPSTSRAAINFARNPILRPSPYAGMLFNGAGRPIDPASPAPAMAASAGGNKTHIVDEAHVFGGMAAFAVEYRAHLAAGGRAREGAAPDRLRRLTVSESAAFQGFPEGFRFSGPVSSVYRQIGNAVPCGLARAAAAAAMAAIVASGDCRAEAA